MNEIDSSYQALREALRGSFDPQGKNMHRLLFFFSQFFHTLNKSMLDADTYEKKAAIIDRFVECYEELSLDQKEILDSLGMTKEAVITHEIKGEDIPLEVKIALGELKNESDAFHKQFRAVIKERDRQKSIGSQAMRTQPRPAKKSSRWRKT